MYKNREGYADPTEGQALNGVRWEELQQIREKNHGIKRGEVLVIRTRERSDKPGKNQYIIRQHKARIVELYKNVVLIEYENGVRSAPSYWTFDKMRKGEFNGD